MAAWGGRRGYKTCRGGTIRSLSSDFAPSPAPRLVKLNAKARGELPLTHSLICNLTDRGEFCIEQFLGEVSYLYGWLGDRGKRCNSPTKCVPHPINPGRLDGLNSCVRECTYAPGPGVLGNPRKAPQERWHTRSFKFWLAMNAPKLYGMLFKIRSKGPIFTLVHMEPPPGNRATHA